MALTVEEKLNRLNNIEDWELYPPEQKSFLTSVANNIDPEVAYARANPDKPTSGRGSARFHAGRLMQYKSIKKALDVIQYVKPEPTYTKREALEDITYRLRKQGLEDETYIKLLSILAKMNGWDKPKPEKPTEEEKKDDINQAVVDLERRRRNGEEN